MSFKNKLLWGGIIMTIKSLESKFHLIDEKKEEILKLSKKAKLLKALRKPVSTIAGICGAIFCAISAMTYTLEKYGALSSVKSIFFATVLYILYGVMAYYFFHLIISEFFTDRLKEIRQETDAAREILGRTERELSQYHYCRK